MALIQVNHNQSLAVFTIATSLTSVQVGDTIVVGGSCFRGDGATTPSLWSCSDNLGNVYDLKIFSGSRSGVGNLAMFVCVVTVAGSPTITINYAGAFNDDREIIAAQFRDIGVFDQRSKYIYDSTDGLTTYGGQVNLVDTTIVSCLYHGYNNVLDPAQTEVLSATGDTVISSALTSHQGQTMLTRSATGPGLGTVQLSCPGAVYQSCLAFLTFSKVLPRPAGTPAQYAIRPGAGIVDNQNYQDTGIPQPGQGLGYINNPLEITFPYVPVLGSSLIVFMSIGVDPDVNSFTVSDAYGNVYTQRGSVSLGPGSCRIAVFTAPITVPPVAGAIFKIQASCDQVPSANVYQSCAMAAIERAGLDLATVQTALWNNDVDAAPTITIVSQTLAVVPANSYLIAMAFYGGGGVQDSIAWGALDSYMIQESYSTIQIHGLAVNRPREGTSVIFDKVASTAGAYNARVNGTITGTYDSHGSILLLAATIAEDFSLAFDLKITASESGPTPPVNNPTECINQV